MSAIPHLSGLSETSDKYDYYFLDIYGLLHNGLRLNPHTLDCLRELKNAGKKTCLLSNTPKMPEDSVRDLDRHGITRDMYDDIVTAGLSAHLHLDREYRNTNCLFLGSGEFSGPLRGLDIRTVTTTNDADFILNSIPGSWSFDAADIIALMHEARAKDLKMICANPDMVVHIGDTLVECAGTYAALYEQLGGHVTYHGKPIDNVYKLAREKMGNPSKDRICAIGDALHTDIRGACGFGIDGIWALSGIHWEELRYAHNPGEPDMDRVRKAISESDHEPAATISGFRW